MVCELPCSGFPAPLTLRQNNSRLFVAIYCRQILWVPFEPAGADAIDLVSIAEVSGFVIRFLSESEFPRGLTSDPPKAAPSGASAPPDRSPAPRNLLSTACVERVLSLGDRGLQTVKQKGP
jgi:hypothetical protein